MKAMILAAGVGERMRPLTNHIPKPLLTVAGVTLLEYHLQALALAGFRELVINVSHLGEQVVEFCGGGERWGLSIAFSREPAPLETAGGILQALPLLGEQPFLVVNGDVWTDYPFARLAAVAPRSAQGAHLVFTDNPPQHPRGDFALGSHGQVAKLSAEGEGVTYAGIGVYSAAFFAGLEPGKTPLRPLLDDAIDARTLTGEHYPGSWVDVGTPERLADLDRQLRGV